MLSSLRSQLALLGLTTFPSLLLIGPQNYGKTRLAQNYNLIYDDARDGSLSAYGLLSLTSSTVSGLMVSLSALRDLVMQVDDNSRSSDTPIQKHNQKVVEVPINRPMTGGQMSDRACAAATFRSWMIWLLPHFDDELAKLRLTLSQLPGGEDARLRTTEFLFNWTMGAAASWKMTHCAFAQAFVIVLEKARMFSFVDGQRHEQGIKERNGKFDGG